MSYDPESPRRLLDKPTFQSILRRVVFHTELLVRIRQRLPAPLAEHCLACAAREDGSLVLFTDSPAWGSKLRFYLPMLLDAVNSDGETMVRQLVIRNSRPSVPAVTASVNLAKIPSPLAIESVKASSKTSPSKELAEALARLGAAMEAYAGNSQ